jgi:hypothetical protein
MLLLAKKVMFEYCALVLKMHQNVGNNIQTTHNLELIFDLEVMMWLSCIMHMPERLNDLIKFSYFQKCFVYDFVDVVKLCLANLYYWYNDLQTAYMHDVFNEYCNLLNGTLDMVVHEWAQDLNTSFGTWVSKLLELLS